MEEARVAYLRDIGHPYQSVRDEGLDFTVLEVFTQYRSPVRFDELVDIHLAWHASTAPRSRWRTCSPSNARSAPPG